MAICSALNGAIAKSCDTNTGGVRKIWIGDYGQLNLGISGGQVTSITADPNNVLIQTATVNTTVSGPNRIITTVVLPFVDYTAILTTGKIFTFTYATATGSGTWTGAVLSSSYTAGVGTTVVPDFAGFTPIVSPSGVTPNNTANQSVSTYILFEFEFNRNTSEFQENLQQNLENGTGVFNQMVMLKLARRESTKRDAIQKLTAGQKKLVAVVLDSNGTYWIMGNINGLYATEISGGSGVAALDQNGYNITLSGEEPTQSYPVTVGAITPLLFNA